MLNMLDNLKDLFVVEQELTEFMFQANGYTIEVTYSEDEEDITMCSQYRLKFTYNNYVANESSNSPEEIWKYINELLSFVEEIKFDPILYKEKMYDFDWVIIYHLDKVVKAIVGE